jgi:hypothetical protein
MNRHPGNRRGPGYPLGAGRVQQLRRRTLRRTPARCHRAAAYACGDGPTYIHEGRRPAVRLQQYLSLCGAALGYGRLVDQLAALPHAARWRGMTWDDDQDAEVEHRAADAQQPGFVEL